MHVGMYIQGGARTWSANRFTGNAIGYWAATDTNQTGILAGSLLGTYDSSASTFNSVAMGAYLETNQFLTMAGKIGSSPNLAALQALNIPAVEVGRTTLSGSNGLSNVTIADAIFFASSTGLTPRLWASGSVSGTYDSDYPGSIYMASTSGLRLYATFNMQSWSAGSPWWATIDDGGGSGLVFKGFAAGTSNLNSTFSGTAAGAVDPTSTFSYDAYATSYLGGTTGIAADSVSATGQLQWNPSNPSQSTIQVSFGGAGSWSYDSTVYPSSALPSSTAIAGASGGQVYSDSGRSNENATGYWISAFSGYTASGGASLSGLSNFAAITQTTLGTGLDGTFSGNINTDGSWSIHDSGSTYTESPLTFVWSPDYIAPGDPIVMTNTDGLTLYSNPNNSTLAGYLGSTSSLWTGSAAPVTMIGTYVAGTVANEAWLTQFFSYNPFTNNYVTYDNGAFYGYMGGIKRANPATGIDALEAMMTALYMDNSSNPNVGILTGGMSGNAYPGPGVFRMDGSLTAVTLNTLTGPVDPSTFVNSISYRWPAVTAGTSYFDGSDAGMSLAASPSLTFAYNSMARLPVLDHWENIIQSEWGIWSGQLYGTYSASIPPSNSWSLELTDASTGYMHTGMYIQGGRWMGNRMAGNVFGYWAATDTSQTGILGGSLLGTYDSTAGTFNSVVMGAYLETNQFLALAAQGSPTIPNTTLVALNIPAVQVGQTTLYGFNGSSSVTIADATFFAYSTGQKPQIWASGNVSGTYSTTGPIYMASTSGLNLYATFNMQSFYPGSPWSATIDDGWGSGLVFKGFAAGTSSGSIINGTAAGAVDPAPSMAYLDGAVGMTSSSQSFTSLPLSNVGIQMTYGGTSSWSYNASGGYSGYPLSSQIIGASGGNVYTDYGMQNWVGYWISTLSGGVEVNGSISGTSHFALITETTMGTGTGTFSGSSGVNSSGSWSICDSGSNYTETPLTFVWSPDIVDGEGAIMMTSLQGSTLQTGSQLDGNLGSTSSLWSGSATPATMIGYYSSGGTNESWLTNVFSYNPFTNQYLTYDGGAFYGYMGGIKRANYSLQNQSAYPGVDALEAIVTALYMDNYYSPNVGILTGSMSGNAYPGPGVFRMDGSLTAVASGDADRPG